MTERTTRKLRAEGLRPTDETVLRVFLGFLSRSGPVDWIMSNDGQAQLLLRDADWSAPTEPASLDDDCAVVWVCSGSQRLPDDGRPVLRRPLQLEDFKDLLRALEAVRTAESGVTPTGPAFAHASGAPAAAAAAPADAELDFDEDDEPGGFLQTRPMSDADITSMSSQATSALKAALRAPAKRGPSVVPPPAPRKEDTALHQPAGDLSYRLRRWPPHDLLRQNSGYPRLASFMAARFVPMEQLPAVSGIDVAVCRRFVQLLTERDMLESRTAVPSAAAGAAEAPAPQVEKRAQAPSAKTENAGMRIKSTNAEAVSLTENRSSRVTLGVLARLRSRFGLG